MANGIRAVIVEGEKLTVYYFDHKKELIAYKGQYRKLVQIPADVEVLPK